MWQPWTCGPPLPAKLYGQLLRQAIFECFKWHTQVEDKPVWCPFPLVLDQSVFDQLRRTAEALAGETLAAEQELFRRVDLHETLGLPRSLRWCLRQIPTQGTTASGPRIMRFDFHWTTEGWRISEANTDVAGGFIEASGVTHLMAAFYPDFVATGDPAGTLAEIIQRTITLPAPVGFMHLACYTEDRQVMLYLARRLQERGVPTCLFHPSQLRWADGQAAVACDWYEGPLSLVFRFYPAEWLPQLPKTTGWTRFFSAGATAACNPAYAILTQSKRFPLVWDRLATPLPVWQALLPETRSPDGINEHLDGEWVVKPALGFEGKDVGISSVTEPADWQRIQRAAGKHPQAWVAQHRFVCLPLPTPEGPMFPCLGIYIIDGRAVGAYGRMGIRPLIDDRSREIAVLVKRS